MWPFRRRTRRIASARLLMAMRSLDKDNLPYTSAVCEFAGGEYIRALRLRDHADAEEMGRVAAVLASESASCQGFNCALRSSIALSSE